MNSKSKILVCTDFSPSSDIALKSAAVIAKKTNAELHAVFVSEIPVYWDMIASGASAILMTEEQILNLHKSMKTNMENQLKRCDVKCETHLPFGLVAEAIAKVSSEVRPDLIVLGNRKKSNMFYLGNVITKVLADSRVPILVTRHLIKDSGVKIAGLVDTHDSFHSIISEVKRYSDNLHGEAEILSLWKDHFSQLTEQDKEEVGNKISKQIKAQLQSVPEIKVKVLRSQEKSTAFHLAEILENDKIDLAVMKRHQKGWLEKFLIGSETRRMLEIFDGNILVLPPN